MQINYIIRGCRFILSESPLYLSHQIIKDSLTKINYFPIKEFLYFSYILYWANVAKHKEM